MTKEELATIPHDDPRISDAPRRIRKVRAIQLSIDDHATARAVGNLADVLAELVERASLIDLEEWREAQKP